MDDCILYCIYEPRLLEDVRAFREIFDKPVVAFTMWQYAETDEVLDAFKDGTLGKLYSLPEFYFDNIAEVQAMTYADLDEKQLALEKEMGIKDNTMMVSYERDWLAIDDYRTMRNLQYINLEFVHRLLEENTPELFWGCMETYIRNVLAQACRTKGIPVVSGMGISIGDDRIGGIDAKGRLHGMPETFEACLKGDIDGFDQMLLQQADEHFDDFVLRPQRPAYVEAFDRSLFNRLKTVVTKAPKVIAENMRMYKENEYDRAAGGLKSSVDSILQWPRKAVRMAYLQYSHFFNKAPDLDRKFIYVPLHFSPEMTDMYFGRDYSHHEGFIMNLAKRIPSEYTLYVKDHPAMVGNRPVSWYQRLKQQYNVELIHPYVPTFSMIRNASAVLTVTGTAGLEGYMLGKPVIVLGDIFYNFLPSVLSYGLYNSDFVEKVREYIDGFVPDEHERRAAMRAFFLTTVVVSPDDGTSSGGLFSRRVREHVRFIYDNYPAWKSWLLENESNIPAAK